MTKVTVGYWNIRGLAQNIRLLLSYTSTPFDEVFYDYDNKTQWFQKDKKDLGFEFPNLPYLIDGNFKLTESSAIVRYVIKRSGHSELLGKNIQDEGSVDSILGVLNDILKEMRGLLLDQHWQESKNAIFDKFKSKLDYLNKFIGDRGFALGYLTYADFMIAEFSYFFEAFYPDQRAAYPFWWRIRNNFELLPGIRAYYQRPNAVSEPFGPSFLKVQPKYNRVKFGYWGIRGLGHVTRLLLGYHGVQFQDVHYSQNHQEKWFKEDKVNLGLSFPNVPYLIDGQYSLTESTAINRYIIAKWGKANGLLGKNIQDSAKLDAFMAIFNEVYDTTRITFFDKDYETVKIKQIEKFLPKLQQLNAFVGERDFAFGYLTLADFLISEGSHYLERLYPEEYKTLPFLQKIRENFNNLPEIIAYYARPTAFKGRFLVPFAPLQVERQ